MKKNIYYLITILFSVIFLLVFGIVLFKHESLRFDIQFLCSNFLILIFMLIFVGLLATFFSKKKISFSDYKCITILTILLFNFELLLIIGIPFKTGWDAGLVFDSAYYNVFSKSHIIFDTSKYYFEMYPNNVCLLLYEMLVAMFTKFIGRKTLFLFLLCFVNCIIYSFIGILVFLIQKRISGSSKIALFSWICYVILVGTSPWILVPYSDSLGLLFPCLIFSFYLFIPKNKYYRWILISLFSFLGYQIKPQILIVFIAIILISYIELIFSKKLKKLVIYTGITIFSYIIVSFPFSFAIQKMELDATKKFGISHFLMMGMNYEANGSYNDSDIKISSSAKNTQERFEKNLDVFHSRIKDYGIFKICRHFYNKILVNFNDGTFFWGGEGNFYDVIYSDMYPERFIHFSWLEEIFYSHGKYYQVCATIRQGFWLFILLLLGISFPKKGEKKEILVLKLSLIGLFLFELLFEARSRYLFTFVPLFVIIALDNFYYCFNRCMVHIRRRK